jgi:small subunit ribosomal protein S14
MARLASIKKNNRKKEISTKYYKYRDELREKAVNFSLSDEERTAARNKLHCFPSACA